MIYTLSQPSEFATGFQGFATPSHLKVYTHLFFFYHIFFARTPANWFTKLQILRWNLSFEHSRCWKFIRIQVHPAVLVWLGFYRQHILSFSLQPFRRLVLPHAHCSSKRKGWLRDIIGAWLVQFVENLARCSLMDRLLWFDLVSSYIFPWAHNGPGISIYRTGIDSVRSCLATKR